MTKKRNAPLENVPWGVFNGQHEPTPEGVDRVPAVPEVRQRQSA